LKESYFFSTKTKGLSRFW